MAQWKRIRLGTMRFQVRSLASLSGLRIHVAVSYRVGHRHGSDLALLWLWRRLANVAPIRPLAWEFPHAAGTALKRQNKTKQKYLGKHAEHREKSIILSPSGCK